MSHIMQYRMLLGRTEYDLCKKYGVLTVRRVVLLHQVRWQTSSGLLEILLISRGVC